MTETVNRFLNSNYVLSIAVGVIAVLGGINLAYFTNDAEPWGTIGGFVSALGLALVLLAATAKK